LSLYVVQEALKNIKKIPKIAKKIRDMPKSQANPKNHPCFFQKNFLNSYDPKCPQKWAKNDPPNT